MTQDAPKNRRAYSDTPRKSVALQGVLEYDTRMSKKNLAKNPKKSGAITAAGAVDHPGTHSILPRARATPCRVEQYTLALIAMERGETWSSVRSGSGVGDWGALVARGLIEHGREWTEIVVAWQRAREQRMADLAQRVAEQQLDSELSETTAPDGGITRTRRRRSDASMIAAALSAIAPERHGRLAGASQVNIGAGAGGSFSIAVQLDPEDPAHSALSAALSRRREAGRVLDATLADQT